MSFLERWIKKASVEQQKNAMGTDTGTQNDKTQKEDEGTSTISTSKELEITDCSTTIEVNNKKSMKVQRREVRKVRTHWLEEFNWLIEKKGDSKSGKICKICDSSIQGGYYHIKRHSLSETHIQNEKKAADNISIENFVQQNEYKSLQTKSKELEIRLCLFVSEHNLPFTCLDHLEKLLKVSISDSKITQNLNMHRAKAQKYIKNIIAPENLQSIINLTKKQYYSLIIDESTDITSSKNLAVIIRLYDKKCLDRFLDLIPIKDSSSQGIMDGILETFNKYNIPLNNMIAFGADNCPVMMGRLNGVQAKLKEIIPNVFVQGCICHNLNIVSKVAFSKLPININKFMIEVNRHFCHSCKKKLHFMEFQEYFGTELHCIFSYSETRWLSRQFVVDRFLEQWVPLQNYFRVEDFDSKYSSENISFVSSCLHDPLMKLYFTFLSFVLKEINDVNIEMQAEDYRMHIFTSRMKYLFYKVARCMIKKSYLDSTSISDLNLYQNNLDFENMFFGTKVELFLLENNIAEEKVFEFKTNCVQFYIAFCNNLREKIDFQNDVLNFIPNFSPKVVLSGEISSIIQIIAKIFPKNEMNVIEKINEEYRKIAEYEELKKYEDFSITEFWNEIELVKNELGDNIFPNICRIVKGLLSIPHSSANVERIFSVQNLVKTKCRNRLHVSTVSSLVQTKDLMRSNAENCVNFQITKNMINRNPNKENEDIIL